MFTKADPGLCPICGAAHTACTAGASRVTVEIAQTPERDAELQQIVPTEAEAVQATLAPGQYTTGTYRGAKKR